VKLENKVAVITGGGSGMGKASALLFAAEGAKVAVVDIDERAAAETANEIEKAGGQAVAIRADVSKEKDAENMIAAAEKCFGPPTIIFNNAGIEGESAYVAKMTEDAFDRVIAINLRSHEHSYRRATGVCDVTLFVSHQSLETRCG
jgi:NAD(P)-dependent dehydrogenase (short-subunit alcohol dehydrogenase family)